jgi:hypothetical protein
MYQAHRRTRRIAFLLLIAPIAILVFGIIVMLLWNNVMVPVLHVSAVTFWQALGMLVLSKILFGSFSGGSPSRRSSWRERMKNKWDNMTPEEKERFRERCKDGRWGYKPWDEDKPASPIN